MKRSALAFTLLALTCVGCSAPNSSNNSTSNEVGNATDTKPASDHVQGLPAGPLSWANLKDAIDQSRAYTPADQFSKPFDASAMAGRAFTVEQPVPNDWWRYDIGKQELSLNVYPTTVIGDWVDYFAVDENDQPAGSSEESNAFGAHVNVDHDIKTNFGVGQPESHAKFGLFPWSGYSNEALTKTLHVNPDQGRSLTSNLTYTLRGVIVRSKDGEFIHCYKNTTDATISNPHQTDRTDCVVSARLVSLSIQSGSNVIATWKNGAKSSSKAPSVPFENSEENATDTE